MLAPERKHRITHATRHLAMGDRGPRVISLRLMRPEEMFVMGQTDLFSEYRNFLTGVEYCISELRCRRSGGPVRLDLSLPVAEIDEGISERISRTLDRYCNHRITHNKRERRAIRLDGLSSLLVGAPIVLLGFLLVVAASRIVGHSGNSNLILDTGGWVLVWVGLWFPLDTLLFTPLSYGRENRALELLRGADVTIRPHGTSHSA